MADSESGTTAARIQLCGRLVATIGDRRIENQLVKADERCVFAYLVIHRLSPVSSSDFVRSIWPDEMPRNADARLNALLRRLRKLVGPELELRPYIQLRLAGTAFVDIEAAAEAVHRAESAMAHGDWSTAWPAARVALHTTRRPFLPGAQAPWIEAQRRRLRDMEVRALECIAATGLALGGNEVLSSERSARLLIEREPLRESGYRYLMAALSRRGNVGEALQVYGELAVRLERDVGITPSAEIRALREQLSHGVADVEARQTAKVPSRTFMFTDICDSTALLSTIGDQAWRHLLEWHDRVVDQIIEHHHGEIMDRAGDGVFVAFEDPGDATRCAIAFQQRLAAHRVTHGFAPSVRIGIHTDQALPTRGKFVGRGVHLAARVAATATTGQILLTSTAAAAARVQLHELRHVMLKGLTDPVELGVLAWDR
jgi:SARP family transcriptional regulator, regulator of embCAB operon